MTVVPNRQIYLPGDFNKQPNLTQQLKIYYSFADLIWTNNEVVGALDPWYCAVRSDVRVGWSCFSRYTLDSIFQKYWHFIAHVYQRLHF